MKICHCKDWGLPGETWQKEGEWDMQVGEKVGCEVLLCSKNLYCETHRIFLFYINIIQSLNIKMGYTYE